MKSAIVTRTREMKGNSSPQVGSHPLSSSAGLPGKPPSSFRSQSRVLSIFPSNSSSFPGPSSFPVSRASSYALTGFGSRSLMSGAIAGAA